MFIPGSKPLRAEFFHPIIINGKCKEVVGNINRVHRPFIKYLLKTLTLVQPLTTWLRPSVTTDIRTSFTKVLLALGSL